MRHVAFLFALTAVVCLAGCNTFGFLRPEAPSRDDGIATAAVPSTNALVWYLDQNSQKVQTLRCEDLVVTCSQGIQTVDLRGQMMCQRPRNFRLSVGHWGKTEVELGSNSDEFWYWLRRGDPYQIHCSYKDLNEGKVRKLPFPFQPEWVIETMGLGNYGPPDQYELDTHDSQTLRLVSRTRSPQGTPVRKVIVFRRNNAHADEGRAPQVTDYLLLDDASGKEICAAKITQIKLDRTTGAILPYKVDMRWPEMKLRMTMKFDGVTVNPNPPIDPALAFQRRPLTGVPGFDLATMRPDGSLQRVQGYERQ